MVLGEDDAGEPGLGADEEGQTEHAIHPSLAGGRDGGTRGEPVVVADAADVG